MPEIERSAFGLMKDAVGLAASAVALGLSIYTLYATHRKIDELGVIVAEKIPLVDIHEDGKFKIVVPRAVATFVNSGTRSAAIVAIRFSIEQPDVFEWRKCNHTASEQFEFEVDPFVIKAGEIVSKALPLSKSDLSIKVRNEARPTALLCLEFDVSTPDGLTLQNTHQYLGGVWSKNSGQWEMKPLAWLSGKTISLFK